MEVHHHLLVTALDRGRTLAARLRADRALAAVWGCAAVGLVLRVAAVLWAARRPQGLFDPARYVGYAEGISAGRGLVEPLTGQPTAYFPPGYPYFLGAVEAVISRTPLPDDLTLVAGLVQAALGAWSVLAVGALARRVHSPRAGVVAAAVVAVLPNLVLHSAAVLSETLSIALLLGWILLLVPAGADYGSGPSPAPGPGLGRLVVAGLVFGALVLVRPVTGGVVVAAGLAWLLAGVGGREALRRAGVIAVVGALCLAPWTVRNLVRMDSFVVLSTNTGDNMCIGHGPEATGGFRLAEDCNTGTGVQDGTEAELESDAEKMDRALSAIRDDWRHEPRLLWGRLVALVDRDDDAVRAVQSYGLDPWMPDGTERILSRASSWSWYLVGAVGVAGMVAMVVPRPRRFGRLLVPLCGLAVVAAPLATFGDARFKVPAVPLLVVAAAALVSGRPDQPAATGTRAGGVAPVEAEPPGEAGARAARRRRRSRQERTDTAPLVRAARRGRASPVPGPEGSLP